MGKNAKDKRDIYYRLAKQKQYRSRSAFKLIQIDSYFNIFLNLEQEDLIVDLCSAPGGWSQVCIDKIKNINNDLFDSDEYKYVIAIDIQKMDQIEGVEFIQGDITNQITIESLNKYSEKRKIKLVICDGAPDITGFTEFDLHIQSQLIYSALNFSIKTLCNKGTFITKMYKGKNTFQILYTLFLFFDKITIAKPKSCRNASFEAFIVCEGFNFEKYLEFINKIKQIDNNEHIKDFLSYAISKEKMNITDMLFFNNYYKIACLVNKEMPQSLNEIGINFVQVGVEDFDSDKTYNLESTGYTEMINPIQMPIDPPYKMYCDKIKGKSSK